MALPDYYKFLNEQDQIWVTPKNHFGNAYGIMNEAQTCVDFVSDTDGEYTVLIIGTRKDDYAKHYWRGAERSKSSGIYKKNNFNKCVGCKVKSGIVPRENIGEEKKGEEEEKLQVIKECPDEDCKGYLNNKLKFQ